MTTPPNHSLRNGLLAIFVLSGFAGLIYQSIWSHYLGLYLGHAAYAQALVLAIFMGGKFIRTIGQARATVAMTMMAACYNLKRLAKFLDDGVDAFYKNKQSKTEVRLQGANA